MSFYKKTYLPSCELGRPIQAGIQAIWLFFCFSCLPNAPLWAQSIGANEEGPRIEFAPFADYFANPDSSFYQAGLRYARLASPQQIDPSVRAIGDVEIARVEIAGRTHNLSSIDFRFRATLVDMDIHRTPISIGMTLLDYNQAGPHETDIQWANLRLGPGVLIGNERNYFSLRARGQAGLTTLKLGSALYRGLGPDATSRKRTYEIGYDGEFEVLVAGRVNLQARFGYRSLVGGARPRMYHVNGMMQLFLSPNVSLLGMYTLEQTRIGSSRVNLDHLRAGMLLRF